MSTWARGGLIWSVLLSAAMATTVSPAVEQAKSVLIVVGPSSHPPGG